MDCLVLSLRVDSIPLNRNLCFGKLNLFSTLTLSNLGHDLSDFLAGLLELLYSDTCRNTVQRHFGAIFDAIGARSLRVHANLKAG